MKTPKTGYISKPAHLVQRAVYAAAERSRKGTDPAGTFTMKGSKLWWDGHHIWAPVWVALTEKQSVELFATKPTKA